MTPHSSFVAGWIGQELDLPHALAQVVEHRAGPFEQGAECRFDLLRGAIKKSDAERVEQRSKVGDLKLFAGHIQDLARTCSLLSRSESKPATDLSSRSASS